MLARAVTVTSIVGYVALSFTINGLPAYPPAGWVAVLQPVHRESSRPARLIALVYRPGRHLPRARLIMGISLALGRLAIQRQLQTAHAEPACSR